MAAPVGQSAKRGSLAVAIPPLQSTEASLIPVKSVQITVLEGHDLVKYSENVSTCLSVTLSPLVDGSGMDLLVVDSAEAWRENI